MLLVCHHFHRFDTLAIHELEVFRLLDWQRAPQKLAVNFQEHFGTVYVLAVDELNSLMYLLPMRRELPLDLF